MIKGISDVNDKLMDLNKKHKDINKDDELQKIEHQTNNLLWEQQPTCKDYFKKRKA